MDADGSRTDGIESVKEKIEMPPNATSVATGVLNEEDAETIDGGLLVDVDVLKKAEYRRISIVWRNVIAFGYLHLAAVYGAWLLLTQAKWLTIGFAFILYVISALGITAGAHRLWAHRSYKAKLPLRIILAVFNTIAFQDAAMDWARDHRVHHKYSETDADPHNATRGFFFSHVGWLLCRKHPDVIAKGKQIDLSDLKADPVLHFQKKYYLLLMPIACFLMPTMIPWYFWGETMKNAWFVCAMFRYTFVLNVTWLVNSAAHKWGHKPYDRKINPAQNPSVAIFAFGEGWHNYHHVFPWDYKTAELGNDFNFTSTFINFFAKIGWAYDLKSVSEEIIERRVKRTGDGSHTLWGWGDRDQDPMEVDHATILHRKKE